MKPLRTDIQALRGLAVLLVLLFHAKLSFLPAGYLGVDVFFVISGFLITGLIVKSLDLGRFSFGDFYWRRAKRLLPAAYVTFFATAALAPLFLGQAELRDFSKQLLGALTFTGNIALWQQTGYFEGAGEQKPLLHVWSLALEEQYYFLLPAMLVLLPQRHRLKLAVFACLASLGLCLIGSIYKPIATFYLLPTRWWELGVGSIGALAYGQSRLYLLARWLFWPSLLALILLPLFPLGSSHPGMDAVLVCSATLMLILRNHPGLNARLPTCALAWVGNFSYSLYLIHWPLFAFANNAWTGEPVGELPLLARLGLLAAALLLGWLLYRLVELPVRDAKIDFSPRLLFRGLSVSLVLLLTGFGVASISAGDNRHQWARRANMGFSSVCEYQADFQPRAECRSRERPALLVWGDSYAMHLVPGLAAVGNEAGVIQATRSACGPMLDVAPVERVASKGYNQQWAERCMSFNRSVLDWLRSADSVKWVVLSSSWFQYLDREKFQLLQRLPSDALQTLPADAGLALAGLQRTVRQIHALGKKAVLVAPPPGSKFDIGACLQRRAEGKVSFGASDDCAIDLQQYHQSRAAILALLARLPAEAGIEVLRLDPYLCDSRRCVAELDGRFLYRDAGHLSYDGSTLLAQRAGLFKRVGELAR